ncbi:MAG: protease complex subunit PrcB family protein [Gemmatimonadaceae bacterium]|nr:protease complex subunit PrcB family protein [Gemmatimonadaceae bacterium]
MSTSVLRHFASALVLATAAGCGGPTGSPDPGLTETRELIVASQVSDSVITALNSGIPDRRRLVIRAASEWAALWREATANISPAPPVPEFDFATEMLLVATMGARPSGGYAIGIDSVYSTGGNVHAVVRETTPDRACMVSAVITSPVVAVRIARSSAPVEFRTRSAVHLCW